VRRPIFLLTVFAFLLATNGLFAEDSCVNCHGNADSMKAYGYPQFFVTREGVLSQSNMPANCPDCHMGNPAAAQKEEAHQGLLSVKAVGRNWDVVSRDKMDASSLKDWPDLQPRGLSRATQLGPKIFSGGRLRDNPEFRLIIWHDKNPETLAFNPVIAEKTCGKCHTDFVRSFLESPMGGEKGAHLQSQYITWTGKSGPQSCGLWVGPLSKPAQESFTDENRGYFNSHSTMPVSEKDAHNVQRTCNQCHVGCLDCHYIPQKKDASDARKGPHTFSKRPGSLSCYGGGRSFSCHAGPLERRRGDGYLRAEFAQAAPGGKKILEDNADIHMRKGLECLDCHEPNKKTGIHGDIKREVDCGKCHPGIAGAHKKGIHKDLDCAACHTPLIGGYAFNFWTAVGPEGKENPITRIQDYIVDAVPPLLLKNPGGTWIPAHLVPHTSGNIKTDEVRLSGRLLFRDRPDSLVERRYFSNDSYAVTGVARDVDDKDHDIMVWMNIDRIAHATGRSRTCDGCHASTTQKIVTEYAGGSYKDVEDGEYTIIADGRGLRVVDFKGAGGGPAPKGIRPFKDKWELKGDFALPGMKDRALYERMKKEYAVGKFLH